MIFSRERRTGAAGRRYKRAKQVAAEQSRLHRLLVQMRRAKHLSQQHVADELGLSQATIAAFERYDNDPRLSTVHRYAMAIGASIQHTVTDDDEPEAESLCFANRAAAYRWPLSIQSSSGYEIVIIGDSGVISAGGSNSQSPAQITFARPSAESR